MKILVAGFMGDNNSSKLLLDKLNCNCRMNKLYLENDFEISTKQLRNKIVEGYDLIYAFGSNPETKKIFLEKRAILEGIILECNYGYELLKKHLEINNYNTEYSINAGEYLCNNIFYKGLAHIAKNKLDTKMAFIHIPTINNIENIDTLADVFYKYIVL